MDTPPPCPLTVLLTGVKLHLGIWQQVGSLWSGTIVHTSGTFWYTGHLDTEVIVHVNSRYLTTLKQFKTPCHKMADFDDLLNCLYRSIWLNNIYGQCLK